LFLEVLLFCLKKTNIFVLCLIERALQFYRLLFPNSINLSIVCTLQVICPQQLSLAKQVHFRGKYCISYLHFRLLKGIMLVHFVNTNWILYNFFCLFSCSRIYDLVEFLLTNILGFLSCCPYTYEQRFTAIAAYLYMFKLLYLFSSFEGYQWV